MEEFPSAGHFTFDRGRVKGYALRDGWNRDFAIATTETVLAVADDWSW